MHAPSLPQSEHTGPANDDGRRTAAQRASSKPKAAEQPRLGQAELPRSLDFAREIPLNVIISIGRGERSATMRKKIPDWHTRKPDQIDGFQDLISACAGVSRRESSSSLSHPKLDIK
jgi:hypothetical protein